MADLFAEHGSAKAAFVTQEHLSMVSLDSKDTENNRQADFYFKKTVAKDPVKLINMGKRIVVVFKKLLAVLESEDLKVALNEDMQHIYDATKIDRKTIAVSSKAGQVYAVTTLCIETLSPLSTISLPAAVRILIPLLIG